MLKLKTINNVNQQYYCIPIFDIFTSGVMTFLIVIVLYIFLKTILSSALNNY